MTVALFEGGATGVGVFLGSATSTRGFDSLLPRGIARPVHGICFTGGSAFGLSATGGVQRYLREQGLGLRMVDLVVPLVPTAAIFDLRTGKPGIYPTEDMAYQACLSAGTEVAEGNVGAGTGATVGKFIDWRHAMAGGVGTTSARVDGITMGALAVVNAFGDVRDPESGRILAGARTAPDSHVLLDASRAARRGLLKESPIAGSNTTLVLIVTDAALNPNECDMTARMAGAGFARVISPVFTHYDGDIVIVLSVGDKPVHPLVAGQTAADLCAEAIVRGVRAALPVDGLPCSAQLAGGPGA
ncbi:P1 family peptidase [Sorangium sp. KYC3313]|uniref:P1 family peptidase n=1 Tax=Sorangium sp. KYC3313 TaxID=3449740 RepID=UPI003F89A7F5